MDGARKEAFFWFFGASGGAGIARGAFPKMYQNTRFIQSLKGVLPTEGGETVGLSPLCGYPQDVSKADLAKIVNNPKTIEEIVDENPYPENFLAVKGYLIYDAFVDGNPDCNPLALRAIFDTFSQSTNVVEPTKAQQKIDSYKADPSGETFKNELLLSKAKGYAAIATLLFLVGHGRRVCIQRRGIRVVSRLARSPKLSSKSLESRCLDHSRLLGLAS